MVGLAREETEAEVEFVAAVNEAVARKMVASLETAVAVEAEAARKAPKRAPMGVSMAVERQAEVQMAWVAAVEVEMAAAAGAVVAMEEVAAGVVRVGVPLAVAVERAAHRRAHEEA